MSYVSTTRELDGSVERNPMTLWRRLAPWLFGGHATCPRCYLHVRFTGGTPSSPSERLIKQVTGDRESVPLHWLEERLAEALYREELRQGAWMTDIGLWGDTVFRREAARLLAGMRAEFGRFVPVDETNEDAKEGGTLA